MSYFSKTTLKNTDGTDISPSTEDSQLNLLFDIKQLILRLIYPAWLDRSSSRLRETAIIESGTVTTVTTCTTVTGLTNIDSYQGKLLIINQNISAWSNAVRPRIT